ncbi:MAG: hypothetical protein AAGD11_10950 [Planctomycetota bacterium]
MYSWLSATDRGTAVLRALPFLLVLIQSQAAIGFDGSVVFLRPGSTSTLGGHVPPQDFELEETVIGIVDAGVLAEGRKPRWVAASTTSTTDEPATTKLDSYTANIRETDAPSVKPLPKPVVADVTTEETSPSLKWIRPKASGNSESATATAKTPKVASRLPSPAAKPLPQPAKKPDTAVASDLSKQLQEEITPPKQVEENVATEEPSPSTYPTPAAKPQTLPKKKIDLPPLTRSQQNLRRKIRNVLTHYYNRPLNTRDRSPWELMHAMLAFEAHSKVLQGGPKGDPITAVGWLCYNQACKRRTLMYVNDDDELRVRVGPALQGHRGQLLAMLAQSRINRNYPMLVEGNELTINDLIEMEKRTCYPRTELTFKLIGLMHYLDSNEKWMNDQGMEWDIPKMIAEEMRQPVRGAACGGTHRLGGLTLAYKTRIRRGEPVDGQYLKAKKFVTRYQQYAYRLQNRDGSFSTEWFRGPGDKDDIDRKLKTTGHILEWLLYAATEKELRHWKTTKAANYLANIMYRNRYKDWEAGPLGHAIHALLVYDRLVFAPYDPPETLPMATQPTSPRRRR